MLPARGRPAPAPRRSRRCWLPAALLTLAAGAPWIGCTVTRDNYRVLSSFLDGVPDPDAPPRVAEAGGDTVRQVGKTGAVVYIHKPYAQNRCQECHAGPTDRFEQFAKVSYATCVKCHARTQTRYRVMHGPVATGQCQWCHDPHDSRWPALLRDRPAALCGQCHTRSFLDTSRAEHRDANRDCLECHVSHGTARHGLLRADYRPGGPGSRPADTPTQPSSPPPLARAQEEARP